MDRRGFLTATLLSLALLAASGAAVAAPTVAPRDVIAPAGATEDVWWYRRWRWRRWGWRRWGWRRRWRRRWWW
jgi:hypothetical protein